jgi:CLIP-associating protein 1/2
MLEEARNMGTLSPEVERLVHVPNGNDAPMTDAPEESPAKPVDEVQIYEDPFTEEAAHAGAQEEERKVLGELPVNESTRGESPTQSVGSSNSDGSPQAGSDAPPTVAEPPQDRAETSRNRRLLASGIERIRTKTLDAHGFRRVQDLAKSRTDIWEGGKRYDELMAVVLEYLQTIDQDAKHAQSAQKLGGLKAQALSLVRALLVLFKPHATKWHAKALVTVLISRKGVESTSHLVADMQRTLDTILDQTRPDKCLDAVLDFLPAATTTTEPTPRMVTMGLQVLRQLAVKCKLRAAAVGLGAAPLDADRRTRLVQVAARYVNDADAEVRKVDVDLASELFDMYDEASRGDFWAEFKGAGADEGRLGLLTYYITKNRKDLTVVV